MVQPVGDMQIPPHSMLYSSYQIDHGQHRSSSRPEAARIVMYKFCRDWRCIGDLTLTCRDSSRRARCQVRRWLLLSRTPVAGCSTSRAHRRHICSSLCHWDRYRSRPNALCGVSKVCYTSFSVSFSSLFFLLPVLLSSHLPPSPPMRKETTKISAMRVLREGTYTANVIALSGHR